jgi:molecular chaperone DnaK (HSP70)
VGYGLGVDLGTSFTRAAISRAGRVRMVPLGEHSALIASVVRVQADGSLATGSDADPSRTGRDFKRRLGDPTPLVIGGQPHSAVSLLAATLKSVLETVTRLEESAPDHVVLSYPAVWGPYRREQFAEVPRRAGLAESAVTITTEPEAAATYYASVRQLTEGDLVAVYDLGGGTFDTTVTRTTGSGTARSATQILGVPEGVEWVGGVDFDEAVLAFLDKATGGAVAALDPRDPASATALRGVRDECVRVKEALSEDDAATAVVTLPGRRTEVPVTRTDFEDMIRTPLESTLAALRRTLASAAVTPAELAGCCWSAARPGFRWSPGC